MICEVVKPKPAKLYRHYSGPCRVPGCYSEAYARGVCKCHYDEIWEADPYGRSQIKDEMMRLGIFMHKQTKGRDLLDNGVSLEVLTYDKWLPETACWTIGRQYFDPETKVMRGRLGGRIKHTKQTKEAEWEAVMKFAMQVDWAQFPADVFARFGELSEAELCGMAWRSTKWSPGTAEKMFVLQLRDIFGADFTRIGGNGMHHMNDNREPGTGAPLDKYTNWTATRADMVDESVTDWTEDFMDDLGE